MAHIKLSWDFNEADDVFCNIYRSDTYFTEDDIYYLTPIAVFKGNYFIDTDVVANKTYFYRITYKKLEQDKLYSEIVSDIIEIESTTDKDLKFDYVSNFVLSGKEIPNKISREPYDMSLYRDVCTVGPICPISAVLPFKNDTNDVLYLGGNSSGTNNTTNGRLIPPSTVLNTADFCIEFILSPYINTTPNATIFQISSSINNGLKLVLIDTLYPFKVSLQLYATKWIDLIIANDEFLVKDYTHICVQRKNGAFYLYINGILQGINIENKTAILAGTCKIGGTHNNTTNYNGLFHSIRQTLAARYNEGNYTVTKFADNLSEDSLYNSVDFLIKFNGNIKKDYSKNNKAIASIGSAVNNYHILSNEMYDNYPSYYFGGAGRLTFSGSNFNTSDFTIEMYIKPDKANSATNSRLVCIGNITTHGNMVLYYSGDMNSRYIKMAIYVNSAWIYPLSSTTSLIENKYYHICLMRKNGDFYLYIDGVLENISTNYKSAVINKDVYHIGASQNNTDLYYGYICGLRITDKARYVTNDFYINKDAKFIKSESVIENLKASNKNNNIELSWDNIDTKVKIFKSTAYFNKKTKNLNPLYNNYTNNTFIDTDVNLNQIYYYGVAEELDNNRYYKLDTIRSFVSESDLLYDYVISNISANMHGDTTFYSNDNNNNITYENNGVVMHTPYFINDTKYAIGVKSGIRTILNEPISTSNFTLELILSVDKEKSDTSNFIFLLGKSSAVVGAGIAIKNKSGNIYTVTVHNGSSYNDIFEFELTSKRWNTIALQRNNNVYTLYINGNKVGTNSNITNLDFFNTDLYIGSNENLTNNSNMCISAVRLTKNIVRYSYSIYKVESFKITDTHFNNVSLLLDFSKSINDFSKNKLNLSYDKNLFRLIDIINKDNKFLYFDGSSHLFSDSITFPTVDFTIEFDIDYFPKVNNTTSTIFSIGLPNQDGFLRLTCDLQFISLEIYSGVLNVMRVNYVEKSNIALVRQSGIFSLYINGKLVGKLAEYKSLSLLSSIYIGRAATLTDFYTGYISNIRITKSDRYIGNLYTLPVRPYYKFNGVLVNNLKIKNINGNLEINSSYKGLAKNVEIYRSDEPMINSIGKLLTTSTNLKSENLYVDSTVQKNKIYYYMVKYNDGNKDYFSNYESGATYDIINWNPSFTQFNYVWINENSINGQNSQNIGSLYSNNSIAFNKGSSDITYNNGFIFNKNSMVMDPTQISLIRKNILISFILTSIIENGIIFEFTIDNYIIKLTYNNAIELYINNAIVLQYNESINNTIFDLTINNNELLIYINGTIIHKEILISTDKITQLKFGSNDVGFSGTIKEIAIFSNSNSWPTYVHDKISGYYAGVYSLQESLNEDSLYKVDSPAVDFKIYNFKNEFIEYYNRLIWSIVDKGTSFKIYRGLTYTTIDLANPIYEGSNLVFDDYNITNNTSYYYRIDHIYNGLVVNSEFLQCDTNLYGYWLVHSANWGTSTNPIYNINAVTRSDWMSNYNNTKSFILSQYTYEANGPITAPNINGTIIKNMIGLTFEIYVYRPGSTSNSTQKLYFEDIDGNLLFYIEGSRRSGGYNGTLVKYGKSLSQLTSADGGSTASIFHGEFKITDLQFIYKSRLRSGNFIKDFTVNVDFTKLYKLRIESTIYEGYSKSATRLGQRTYTYIKCI